MNEGRSNGVLIASAPDMLAALKACEEELRVEHPRIYFIVMNLRNAIAKAEGRAK